MTAAIESFSDNRIWPAQPTAVIMAKWLTPGEVNTRLITDSFSAEAAAAAAFAFLRCITIRLHHIFHGNVIIATSPDEAIPDMKRFIATLTTGDHHSPISIHPQGTGDLGRRMERIWQLVTNNQEETAKPTTPVCFFGMDSPDIPTPMLSSLRDDLAADGNEASFDIAAGPTDDGGYWTLAARNFHPQVLRKISWGGDTVFQDTRTKAQSAGLRFHSLGKWYDIDTPDDLADLIRRLNTINAEQTHDPTEKPLYHLRKELQEIMAKQADASGN